MTIFQPRHPHAAALLESLRPQQLRGATRSQVVDAASDFHLGSYDLLRRSDGHDRKLLELWRNWGRMLHRAHLPTLASFYLDELWTRQGHRPALADLVEVEPDGRFHLRGRNADLLEIAGKRASLGDMTRKLLAIPGVEDGIVVQLDGVGEGGVRRIAALAVAPTLDEAAILAALRRTIDPVFLPRPLRCVATLPRNETGKLTRESVAALLQSQPA